MYVRTIKHHIRPSTLDEFDRLWQAFWSAPQAKAPFIGTEVYWGVDRAANTAISNSVWAELPDEIPAYTALVGPVLRTLYGSRSSTPHRAQLPRRMPTGVTPFESL